jgi:hypothetical protein
MTKDNTASDKTSNTIQNLRQGKVQVVNWKFNQQHTAAHHENNGILDISTV